MNRAAKDELDRIALRLERITSELEQANDALITVKSHLERVKSQSDDEARLSEKLGNLPLTIDAAVNAKLIWQCLLEHFGDKKMAAERAILIGEGLAAAAEKIAP